MSTFLKLEKKQKNLLEGNQNFYFSIFVKTSDMKKRWRLQKNTIYGGKIIVGADGQYKKPPHSESGSFKVVFNAFYC